MGAGLSSRQGVHPPATGEAVRQGGGLEGVDHGEDVLCSHGASKAVAQGSEHGPNG